MRKLDVANRKILLVTFFVLLMVIIVGCRQNSPINEAVKVNEYNQLAYSVYKNGDSVIWNGNISQRDVLLKASGDVRNLQWSPDGYSIAWILYDYTSHKSSMWYMDCFEHKQPQLVISPQDNLLGCEWSPTGEIWRVTEFDPTPGILRVLDIYGISKTSLQRVPVWFEDLPFESFSTFAISPNWQYIVYQQVEKAVLEGQSRNGETWVIYQFPSEFPSVYGISWSSDSQWLVFGSKKEDQQRQLFLTQPSSSDILPLILMETEGYGAVLSWSPSGKRIAFKWYSPHTQEQVCYTSIPVQKELTHCWSGISRGDDSVHWLSDNEWIFATNRIEQSQQHDLYYVSLNENSFVNLTQDQDIERAVALGRIP